MILIPWFWLIKGSINNSFSSLNLIQTVKLLLIFFFEYLFVQNFILQTFKQILQVCKYI